MAKKTVADAVSNFGASVKSKLANVAIAGAPEDQLRGPLETLFRELGEIAGLPANAVHLVGEATQSDLKTRPDFAVTVSKALVGFIEVKAPGKGADPPEVVAAMVNLMDECLQGPCSSGQRALPPPT